MSDETYHPMDASRFARVEELFQAALDLPIEQREAFLQNSESDPNLRADVARLLRRHADSDTTLRSAFAAAATIPDQALGQVGPYRVLSELGVGGMGTVLLAERMLGDTRQKVALKLIRGFPTAQARERLARERSLLAELNHPNIARLVDAGETDDHVPYLAMEYVEGTALHAFCSTHGLNLRRRLRLFVQLCRAVQHAHQRLIVHRDIKPGNILVREGGTPVLLDFGIGKLIDATDRDETATRIFTPAYAAPEQIAGRAVTTATDIYGLGCVLYELLSGRSLHEVNIGGRIPPPSATAIDTTQGRVLRGDLDTLVCKAMHEEPERRYASAQALADDIENYLSGKPLTAAPDNLSYRARKFILRHRIASIAAIAVLALVGVFVWRLYSERQRALQAEAHAERESQSTRRSRDFLVSLFQAAAPGESLGHALTARELIDRGTQKLAEDLKDEPESAARVAMTIAEVYAALGDPKAAIESGERALVLAAGDSPDRALLRADILLVLGSEYDNTERFDEARRTTEEALALREKYAPDDRTKIAMTLTDLGNAASRRGDYDAARAYFNRAIPEFEKLPDIEPVERANVLRGLAEVDFNAGKLPESIRDAEQSLQALATLPEQSPERLEPWRVLARAKLAHGEAPASTAILEHALDIAHISLGENSTKVSNVENDLAVSLNSQGRYKEAIAHLEKSIAIDEKLRPDERAATAFSIINLGSIYESRGDYEKAEMLMKQGIAAIEAETPDEPQLDFFRSNLARTLMFRGDLKTARQLMERSLTGIGQRDGEKSFGYAFQVFRLARIELASGNVDAAEQTLRDCVNVIDPLLPPTHPLRAQISIVRAMIAKIRGDFATAQREYETAEATQAASHDPDPVTLAITRARLGGVLLARNDAAGAKRKLDQSLPILQDALVPQAIELIEAQGYQASIERIVNAR
jgi:eukaryotic-like serine/threonine-protein kinase